MHYQTWSSGQGRLVMKRLIDAAEPQVTELEGRRKQEQRLAGEIARLEEAARLAEQVKRIDAAGLPGLNTERESLQADQQAKAALMTGYRPDYISQVPERYLDLTLSAAVEMAVSETSRAEHDLATAKNQLAEFQRLRDQSIALAQQLRAIADQIRLKSPRPDQCPLCHAHYGEGELAQRMSLGVDEEVEFAGQALLEHVRKQEQAHGDTVKVKGAIDWIKGFVQAVSLFDGVPLRTALNAIEEIRSGLSEAMERLAALQS